MKGIEGKESLKAKGRRHETEFTRGERARPSSRVFEGIFRLSLQLSRIDSSIGLTSTSTLPLP